MLYKNVLSKDLPNLSTNSGHLIGSKLNHKDSDFTCESISEQVLDEYVSFNQSN